MRFRLRTLLIFLAILPPLLAIVWVKWQEYREHLAEQQRRAAVQSYVPVTGPSIILTRQPGPPPSIQTKAQ
jgi:hypothetical protein